MYAYDNGIKNKNVGFAKTERKGGTVKLWINLKGAYAQEDDFNVYFFVRRDNAIVGIYMGSMTVKNGMGQLVVSCSESGMDVPFDEIRGLYIKGAGNRMFASQWDDLSFEVEKITTFEEYNAAAATAEAAVVVSEKTEEPFNEDTKISNKSDTTTQVAEASAESPAENTVVAEPSSGSTSAEPPVWERPIKMMYVDGETGTQLHASEESGNATQEPVHSEMDMLFDGKEPKLVFSEDEIYDCVDIGLEELPKIKCADKGLLNNSFVNHGYFNFHHLLLGKKDGNILVVGVPGIYNRREKMTANMFGFEKFKFSMRSDVCMNHFGYWYKEYQC